METDDRRAPASVFAGIFLVALSTVAFQVLLTRIFSVTMWYHFAFMAISLAMFGLTTGAVFVYLRPGAFAPTRILENLARCALLFSVSIVASILVHANIPFFSEVSLRGFSSVLLHFTVIAIPFFFSGIAICAILTRFRTQVSQLYAADLGGAAVGCVAVILLLRWLGGPLAVLAIAAIAASAASLFAGGARSSGWRILAATVGLGFALFAIWAQGSAHRGDLLRLTWVKGNREAPPLYERWNSFSRIQVNGDVDRPLPAAGWGMSPKLPPDLLLRQLHLNIDSSSGTVLTAYDGDTNAIRHLAYDVTNLAGHLRDRASVLVIGVGGGRDILSAFLFNQASVTGIELNEEIVAAVNGRFGKFTGHLDRDPRVKFIVDEARSAIGRMEDRFDIIQISLVDTWAATSAGAFVLAEHSLYTVEAWKLLLSRLKPDGLLAVSRWYANERPSEVYRLVGLAATALTELGVRQSREHLALVRNRVVGDGSGPDGVGTILACRSPLSDRDMAKLDSVCDTFGFEMVLSPRSALDVTFEDLAAASNIDVWSNRLRRDLSPPTDDRPFFFHVLRFWDLIRGAGAAGRGWDVNQTAVFVLASVLMTVVALTVICVVLPLWVSADRGAAARAGLLLVFFASIGFGFMLVEVAQMQRLIVFLGHPTYGLSVVLFGLLLSSGVGSLATSGAAISRLQATVRWRLAGLLVVVGAVGLSTPHVLQAMAPAPGWQRIGVALVGLFLLGVTMGCAFPLGMKVAHRHPAALAPWLWGVNGATSICASVLAIVIALNSGISSAYWCGFGFYVVAATALLAELRRQGRAS